MGAADRPHRRAPRPHDRPYRAARRRLIAAAFAPGYYGLLAGLAGAGMLGASATSATGRAVMGWFPRSERGTALGVRQMAMPLGGAIER